MLSTAGAIQRVGLLIYNNAAVPIGTTAIVAAGSNTNGVIVRTAVLTGSTAPLNLFAGTTAIMSPAANQQLTYMGPGFLLPAGQALQLNASAVGCAAAITYDVL